MSDEPSRSSRRNRTRHTFSAVASATLRLLGDVLVISLWVLVLTLVFLETGWPRWTFYGLLLVGIGLYVSVTPRWTGKR
ncbi:hypothetical protein E2L06_04410 [Haloterrigena sp. H1]|uniref:hypothetical protein n=1 Tax=Haloterrigena sp. H1 TaxID=2552943 RepID=UPI00110E1312|nr:hypothetical protein [Haloterrigena sp. H1]TMT85874.1 hypothetical protein E2L06_04410 [Haloterrigena sp. H1]